MLKIVVLLSVLAYAAANPAAGKPWRWVSPMPKLYAKGPAPNAHLARIVGGSEATPHAWPHQAALFIDQMYFCGGSLISPDWVLTAAHCMDGAGVVEVVLGAHNIRQFESSQQSLTSYNFFTHESWNSWTLANDIALIKLPSSVSYNQYIRPVSLPSSDIGANQYVTPTGWGKPSDSASGTSDVLRQVTVPTISNSDCRAVFGMIGDGVVCINTAGGRSTCNGDSGGPLNMNGMTYGITSFGSSQGCEKGYPAAFTRVAYYRDWIRTNTGV